MLCSVWRLRIGSTGSLLLLANLNGANGFKIDGESVPGGDYTGWSGSGAGDVNNDGS